MSLNKELIAAMLVMINIMISCSCGKELGTGTRTAADVSASAGGKEEDVKIDKPMNMTLGSVPVNVEWKNTESVKALTDLADGTALTVKMSAYGSAGQLGTIKKKLPAGGKDPGANAGDIVLYPDGGIAVLYGSDKKECTVLGHITGKSAGELKKLLAGGDVTVTLSTGAIFTGGYTVTDQNFTRDGKNICGKLFIPNGCGSFPAVIIGHGFGSNMYGVEGYARALADKGIAAYIFDFIGGGNNIKSDGATTGMSVLTEKADLNAIFEGISQTGGIDPDNIFAMGESQGGFVATCFAASRPDDVRGLIALYPAYVIQDDTRKRVPDINNIPETMNVMGMELGRIYNADALSFDIYDEMAKYTGNTLIIHGTADTLAPISYSERAVKTFPHAELVRIDGAGHGFGGRDAQRAAELTAEFIKENIH